MVHEIIITVINKILQVTGNNKLIQIIFINYNSYKIVEFIQQKSTYHSLIQ